VAAANGALRGGGSVRFSAGRTQNWQLVAVVYAKLFVPRKQICVPAAVGTQETIEHLAEQWWRKDGPSSVGRVLPG